MGDFLIIGKFLISSNTFFICEPSKLDCLFFIILNIAYWIYIERLIQWISNSIIEFEFCHILDGGSMQWSGTAGARRQSGRRQASGTGRDTPPLKHNQI